MKGAIFLNIVQIHLSFTEEKNKQSHMHLIAGYKSAQITAELSWYCFCEMTGINMGILFYFPREKPPA